MVTRENVSVAVIGAGLAGAACARALALRGFRVSVFERESQPATAASGNPMGILHPLISADHNLASQWVEAGVATTLRWLGELQEWTATPPSAARGDEVIARPHGWTATPPSAARGDEVIARPHGQNVIAKPHGQNVIARPQSGRGNPRSDTIGARCPVLQMNADCSELIYYTDQGAWIRPAKFVQACLDQACAHGAKVFFNCELRAMEFSGGPMQEFDHVIVANGAGAIHLLPHAQLRLNAIRGTITSYELSEQRSLPCIICASGYATPVIDGCMVVGASYDRIDEAGNIEPDLVSNLMRLEMISPSLAEHCATAPAQDRTSVRIATHDRMPHVGRVLGDQALLPSMSQLHHLPRSDRVWVLAGLGSRGLSFAPLGAEVIADQLSGRTPALPQRLLDAADPVRFALRQHQRRAGPPSSC